MITNIGREHKKGVILFEDATYFSVVESKATSLLEKVDEAYVISDDLEARGISGKKLDGFATVDYPQAVDLIMEKYDHTITI